MNAKIEVLVILLGLLFLPLMSVSAQSCNPAAVNYIVRDEKGNALSGEELKSIHQQLPETIGNGKTAVSEVSFTSDGVTYYWPESVDWEKGKKVSSLEFANAATCTLNLPRVDLEYHAERIYTPVLRSRLPSEEKQSHQRKDEQSRTEVSHC